MIGKAFIAKRREQRSTACPEEKRKQGSLTVSEDTIIKGTRLLRTDRGELRTCKNVGVKDTASGKASNDSAIDLALGETKQQQQQLQEVPFENLMTHRDPNLWITAASELKTASRIGSARVCQFASQRETGRQFQHWRQTSGNCKTMTQGAPPEQEKCYSRFSFDPLSQPRLPKRLIGTSSQIPLTR